MAYFKRGHLVQRVTITTTTGGATILIKGSPSVQRFIGTLNETVTLPDATTMDIGQRFEISNRGVGVLSVNFSDASLAKQVQADAERAFILVDNTTAVGIWDITTGTAGLASNIPNAELLETVPAGAVIALVEDPGDPGAPKIHKNQLIEPDGATTFETGGITAEGGIAIASIAPDKYVIAFSDDGDSNFGKVAVGTRIGNQISILVDTPIAFDSTGTVSQIGIAGIDTDKFVVVWNDGTDLQSRVGTVSGTTPSFPSAPVAVDSPGNGASKSIVRKVDTNKFAVAFKDSAVGAEGIVIGESPATTPSYGTFLALGLGIPRFSMTVLNTATICLSAGGGSTTNFRSISIDGTTLSSNRVLVTADQPQVSGVSAAIDVLGDSGNFIIAFADESDGDKLKVAFGRLIEGDVFVVDSNLIKEVDTNGAATIPDISIRSLDENKFHESRVLQFQPLFAMI